MAGDEIKDGRENRDAGIGWVWEKDKEGGQLDGMGRGALAEWPLHPKRAWLVGGNDAWVAAAAAPGRHSASGEGQVDDSCCDS